GGDTRKAVGAQLKVERKGGQLLKQMPERRGVKKFHVGTFKELGIEKHEAMRWQQIASLEQSLFEELVSNAPKLTQGVLLHHAQRLQAKGKSHEAPPPLPTDEFDVIYADPPWPYEIQF